MKVLMVTAEYAPLAKTGGLADAVAGLAGALVEHGHDVRVLMPGYGRALPDDYRAEARLDVGSMTCTAARHTGGGPLLYRLESAALAAADGRIYMDDARDGARFWAFNRGALDVAAALDWRPDVLHCHDWHAALVPALAKAAPHAGSRGTGLAGVPSMLTLHNAGYPGAFGRDLLPEDALAAIAPLEDEHSRARDYVVFLELGIRYADLVTTVSPTYAAELCSPELGTGLDGLLRERRGDFVGVLNGVDYSLWSPESDPFIEAYPRHDPEGKRRVKKALCRELGLAPDAPLIGAVTRLVEQKGIDLLAGALPALLERTRARFALLGSGDGALEAALRALADAYPERIVFRSGYDEALAHRIIAGSDLLTVPSRYEPCGLTQLYAMRYGTIPVVRKTGGLADTVTHFDPAAGAGTGSVFEHANAQGLVWGLTTALEWYEDPACWRRLTENALAADCSWQRQSGEYEALYRRLAESARTPA